MIRVEVLGGLRVFSDEKELGALPQKPKRAALLVYLAVEGEVSREKARFLLWPDSPDDRARGALNQTLFELKQELGRSWIQTVGERLVVTPDLEVDLNTLQDVLDEGHPDEVLDLYRGPFLEDVRLREGVEFGRWIDGKRAEIHRRVRVAFQTATEASFEPESRVELARSWVDLDPLEDEAQHSLIEALAMAGRRTAALQQYRDYRALISTELEIEPLDHTKELVERIKQGELPVLVHPEAGPDGSQSVPSPHESPSTDSESGEGVWEPLLGPGLQVVRHLRSGSTGDVFLAREPALRRQVAAKVLDPELARHAIANARFEREARLAARILHPNVATVFRVGMTADQRPFFIMPYIKGVTLADRIRARGPMTSHEVVRIVSESASALAAAHAAGVIHRDVRPANVLCEESTGRTYLADFGVAGVLDSGIPETTLLTKKGEVLGNPQYISPEQQAGKPLDDRSDVYSLGVMGLELLLGRPTRHVADLRSADPVDPALVDLLRRSTADEPHHRPSAAELAAELARLAAEHDPGTGLLGRLRKRRMLPFVAAYLTAGLGGMGGVDQLVQQELVQRIAYHLALALFVAGLNATIILAWFHGERGRQRVSGTEIVLLCAVFIGAVIATIMILA